MQVNKNNHLFISASVSLILIAFFIVVAKDKTDILLVPKKPEITKDDLSCKEILKTGLTLQIKDSDYAISAMNSTNTSLEDILELESIITLKNSAKCLGRSPLEINIDQFAKGISTDNDPLANLKILNKISSLLDTTLGSSTVYKNINLKVVTNLDFNTDGNQT